MAQQYTPWQKMKAYEHGIRKVSDYWFILKRCSEPKQVSKCPKPTYYHNGKINDCCKTEYDYNFGYCEGYDQNTHRCDRKHPFFYMSINDEEKYPCRTVPLLTNSNYGHRPPLDPMGNIPKKNETKRFFRSRGAVYCIDANGYQKVNLLPTTSFRYNQGFGYTYSPPKM